MRDFDCALTVCTAFLSALPTGEAASSVGAASGAAPRSARAFKRLCCRVREKKSVRLYTGAEAGAAAVRALTLA